MPDNVNSEGLS